MSGKAFKKVDRYETNLVNSKRVLRNGSIMADSSQSFEHVAALNEKSVDSINERIFDQN